MVCGRRTPRLGDTDKLKLFVSLPECNNVGLGLKRGPISRPTVGQCIKRASYALSPRHLASSALSQDTLGKGLLYPQQNLANISALSQRHLSECSALLMSTPC